MGPDKRKETIQAQRHGYELPYDPSITVVFSWIDGEVEIIDVLFYGKSVSVWAWENMFKQHEQTWIEEIHQLRMRSAS